MAAFGRGVLLKADALNARFALFGKSVTDFGVTMDGTTDDGPYWADAINWSNAEFAAGRPCALNVPAGISRIATTLPTFYRHGSLIGTGQFKSNIVIDPAYSAEAVFGWSETAIPSAAGALGTYLSSGNPATQPMGPIVQGLTFWGDRTAATIQNAMVFYDRCDRVMLRDVFGYYIRGRLVWTGPLKNNAQGYLRETAWQNVEARNCGDESGIASFDFESNGTGDASNEIWINDLRAIFSYGPHIRIVNNNPDIGIRRMFFEGGQIHGFDSAKSGGGYPNNGDLVQIGSDTASGQVTGVRFRDYTFNACNSGSYCVAFRAKDSATMPYDIYCHITIGDGRGGGVNIDAGRGIEIKIDSASVTETLLRVGSTAKVGNNIIWDAQAANTQAGTTFDIDSTVTAAGYFKRPAHLVGHPQGATGFSVQQSISGSTTNGNARGAGAVDLQSSRTNAANVASGTRATILGGTDNKASGTNAVAGGSGSTATSNQTFAFGLSSDATGAGAVTFGQNNVADGSFAHARGNNAIARGGYGADAWASGKFSVAGDAQARNLVVRAQTTDATKTRLTSDQTAAGTANQLLLPNSGTFMVRFSVIARQTGGSSGTAGDSAGWDGTVLVKRGASVAATAVVGGGGSSISPTYNDAAASAWRLSAEADTTNGALGFSITGEANKSLNAVARILSVEAVG